MPVGIRDSRRRKMHEFNSIHTERLLIRKMEITDKEDLFLYRSLPEVYLYQSWRPSHVDEAIAFITRNAGVALQTPGSWMQFAICLHDGKLIGDIGIRFLEDPAQVEVGYTLSPDYQGKGYAFEALKAMIDYIFQSLNMHRITASVDPDNKRSIRLLDKIGFRKEAHFVKSYWNDGKWSDDCIFAVLREEWT